MKQPTALRHFNYAVSFSDRSVKVGITATPFYRLQDYLQEARRHGKRIVNFSITPPAKNKRSALNVESRLCELFDQFAIDGHREWFRDDLSWCWSARSRAKYAGNLSEDVFFSLRFEWDKEHRWYRTPSAPGYSAVIEFAERLGRCGDRISASQSTAIAEQLVEL